MDESLKVGGKKNKNLKLIWIFFIITVYSEIFPLSLSPPFKIIFSFGNTVAQPSSMCGVQGSKVKIWTPGSFLVEITP